MKSKSKKEKRKDLAMKTVKAFNKDGIEFIPMPVLNPLDRVGLVQELIRRLIRIGKQGLFVDREKSVN